MAPQATVNYYEARNGSINGESSTLDALNRAGSDSNDNRQITSSWGSCEAASADDPFTRAAENIFQSNSATGHDYLFSSGDDGSWCGGSNTLPDYPATSRYVTAVGGTSFTADVAGGYPGETAWESCSHCKSGHPEASGGGFSDLFGRPSWQANVVTRSTRGIPDVAADADPDTGALVFYGAGNVRSDQLGGTSLASPLWAGILADTNQYVLSQTGQSLGFVNSKLYALARGHQLFPAFHDITAGSNGAYEAHSGWDPVTGLGSPNVWNLARDFAPPEGTLTGRVSDVLTKEAIGGATVMTRPASSVVKTNSAGAYDIPKILAGVHSVTVSMPCYLGRTVGRVAVQLDRTTTQNFSLTPSCGTLTGRITDASTAKPLAGATVMLHRCRE